MASTVGRRPLGTILRKRVFFVLIVAALLVFTVTLALEASEQETADCLTQWSTATCCE